MMTRYIIRYPDLSCDEMTVHPDRSVTYQSTTTVIYRAPRRFIASKLILARATGTTIHKERLA